MKFSLKSRNTDLPEQNEEVRAITSFNLLQNSHSEQRFNQNLRSLTMIAFFVKFLTAFLTEYLCSQRQEIQHILQHS